MKRLMPFLVIAGLLMVGIKTPKAEVVCYDGVCFPDGERSFADSYISYDPGPNVSDCCDNPSSVVGSPDYEYDEDGSTVSLGCYGVLVVKFTDNSLTTSGDTDEDLWVFEVGAYVESTNIDISTDGENWIEVGSTSGATSGIDIDAYTGDGVVLGEQYSYVRIIDKECRSQSPPYPGADIDAVGAIESAPPVVVTTTTTIETTTTIPPETTTTVKECPSGSCISSGECTDIYGAGWACISGCCEQVPITTTTTTPADTTTTVNLSTTTTLRELGCGNVYEWDCGFNVGRNDGWCCEVENDCLRDPEDIEDYCITKDTPECLAGILYESYSGEVKMLRRFRDGVLTQSPEGQELIRLYYQWSPAIVQAMENDAAFKEEVKEMVDGVLELIE